MAVRAWVAKWIERHRGWWCRHRQPAMLCEVGWAKPSGWQDDWRPPQLYAVCPQCGAMLVRIQEREEGGTEAPWRNI